MGRNLRRYMMYQISNYFFNRTNQCLVKGCTLSGEGIFRRMVEVEVRGGLKEVRSSGV